MMQHFINCRKQLTTTALIFGVLFFTTAYINRNNMSYQQWQLSTVSRNIVSYMNNNDTDTAAGSMSDNRGGQTNVGDNREGQTIAGDNREGQITMNAIRKGQTQPNCYVGPNTFTNERLQSNGFSLDLFSGCRRLIHNLVPKCASRTTTYVIHGVQSQNAFQMVKYPTDSDQPFKHNNTNTVLEWIDGQQQPFYFSSHSPFVNFNTYGFQQPAYVSVIRDPLDRLISIYYFMRYGSPGQEGLNHHFKGEANLTLDECVDRASLSPGVAPDPCVRKYLSSPIESFLPIFSKYKSGRAALEEAKRNIAKHYVVVGIQEELEAFYNVTEMLLPQFYTGATDIFRLKSNQFKNHTATVYRPNDIQPRTREKLMSLLKEPYELYNFVRQRFHQLAGWVRDIKERRERAV